MQFVNHTPFPALAFEGIDQHDQAFHVVVLRQTLSFDSGKLTYAEQQEPLCEEDAYFGEMGTSSVRQESDLCHYKPKCDVIVNAVAYAPQGKALPQFTVRLKVQSANTKLPPPRAPISLNPTMAPSAHEMQAWRAALERAQTSVIAGELLIDKTLSVTGPRAFKTAKFGLGIGLGTWRLTSPAPVTQVLLRNEFAFGGQCRIDASDPAAPAVPSAQRLTTEQQANHPSAEQPAGERAIAHSAFEANPIGCGYSRQWYVKANGVTEVQAPQIEHPDAPVTLGHFKQCLDSDQPAAKASGLAGLTAGVGIRPKGHPERRSLSGTIDDAFIKGSAWLPQDFDFAVWNAAWPDQQTSFLQGNESFELTNLCPPHTPGATVDSNGNSVLRLVLLGHMCAFSARLSSGDIAVVPMNLDTVVIEPDSGTLSLVWRGHFAKHQDAPVRLMEALHYPATQRLQLLAAVRLNTDEACERLTRDLLSRLFHKRHASAAQNSGAADGN